MSQIIGDLPGVCWSAPDDYDPRALKPSSGAGRIHLGQCAAQTPGFLRLAPAGGPPSADCAGGPGVAVRERGRASQKRPRAPRGEMTVLSDDAEIMKRLPKALPQPGRSIKKQGGLLRLTVE
jgi:hypothetical protein